MTGRVLVTGATGTVGRNVVAALADRDVTVRSAVRDPSAVAGDIAAAGEVCQFDFAKPETWGDALADVDGVFLMRPPTANDDDLAAFVGAAARVGVSRVAYLSTLGAEKNVLVPHHRIEKRVAESGVDYTLLRASFFMQNLSEVHRADIVDRDEIFVPAGRGETSFVDARDVGEAAAVALTESGHADRAYDITGPESMDYEAVAAVFSDVLGRPVTYPNPSLATFARRMYERGHSPGFIALMCGIYTTARLGLAGRVSDDARRLLGRTPRTMRTFVEDYADEFRADSPPVETTA